MGLPASRRTILHRACSGVVDNVQRLSAAWHQFWFRPIDPLMIGVIRLLTGWMLLYNLIVWSLDLQAFFGDDGLQPLAAIRSLHSGDPIFSFWLWTGDAWLWPMHYACVAIASMFFLGIASRVTSILCFLITISYSQRVPIANFGFDQILGFLCLYLSLAPSGAAVSVDALIRRWWRNRKGLSTEVMPSSSAQMASRLIQLHLCAIYLWAGFSKLKGPSWWTGEAMWRVIANQEYQTMDLTWMAHVPWLPYLIAHITIAWEVSFIVLVWNQRLRPLILLVGLLMHLGIGAFLGMWTFGLIMAFAYFSFSDPAVWRRRLNAVLNLRRSSDIVHEPIGPKMTPSTGMEAHLIAGSSSDDELAQIKSVDTVDESPKTETFMPSDEVPDNVNVDSDDDYVNDFLELNFESPEEASTAGMPDPNQAPWQPANESLSSDQQSARLQQPHDDSPDTDDVALSWLQEDGFSESVVEHSTDGLLPVEQASLDSSTVAVMLNEPEPVVRPADTMLPQPDLTESVAVEPVCEVPVPATGIDVPRDAENVTAPQTMCICVVSGNASERSALRNYLRSHQLSCIAVPDCDSALTSISRNRFDAVLIHCNGLSSREVLSFCEDVADLVGIPSIVLLRASQIHAIDHLCRIRRVSWAVLPASLKDIRLKLSAEVEAHRRNSGH